MVGLYLMAMFETATGTQAAKMLSSCATFRGKGKAAFFSDASASAANWKKSSTAEVKQRR